MALRHPKAWRTEHRILAQTPFEPVKWCVLHAAQDSLSSRMSIYLLLCAGAVLAEAYAHFACIHPAGLRVPRLHRLFRSNGSTIVHTSFASQHHCAVKTCLRCRGHARRRGRLFHNFRHLLPTTGHVTDLRDQQSQREGTATA